MALNFDVLAFFKAELTATDLRDRLNCVAGMDSVAAALGSQKTAEHVLPLLSDYLSGKLPFEDEEVPLAIAKKLPSLSKVVNPSLLVPLLELLATQDETVLREASVHSLSILITQFGSGFVTTHVLPLLTRLFNDQWFSAKVSACGLIASVYPLVTPASQVELRRLYFISFDDDTPMVRRAAGLKLPDVLKVIHQESILLEFLPAVKRMASDETQESLRLSSLQCCAIMGEHCKASNGSGDVTKLLRSLVTVLSKDKSWRVRMVVARHFVSFCTSFGDEVARSELLPILISFLKDAEVDVRQAATQVMKTGLGSFTNQQVCTLIVPEVIFIAADVSPAVRSACVEILPALIREIGEDDEPIDQSPRAAVIALVQEAFRDETYSVRVTAVQVAFDVCRALGPSDASEVMIPLIAGIACDSQWRVKVATTEMLPAFASLFGLEVFEHHLHAVYVACFSDSVYTVREEAIARITDLTTELGLPWLTEKLWPRLAELFSPNQSYLNRVTVLHAIRKVAPSFPSEAIERLLLPIIIQGFSDPVPNVQLCACATLQAIQPLLSQQAMLAPAKIVEQLVYSSDKDVSFIAKDTVAKLAA